MKYAQEACPFTTASIATIYRACRALGVKKYSGMYVLTEAEFKKLKRVLIKKKRVGQPVSSDADANQNVKDA